MKTAIIKTAGRRKEKFRFILKAANGNTVARSWPETYTQKHSAIDTLQKCFPEYKIIDETK